MRRVVFGWHEAALGLMGVAATFASAQGLSESVRASIIFSCYNPAVSGVVDQVGNGTATPEQYWVTFAALQMNVGIGIDHSPRALNVDDKNHAVCTATVANKYLITHAIGLHPLGPHLLRFETKISPDGRSVQIDAIKASDLKGVVNTIFVVGVQER